MEYIEKLKDPRWQRRRLEIFKRDNFTCQNCGETRKMLNIHHKRYVFNLDPWEHEDKDLITYCEDCHKNEHRLKDRITYDQLAERLLNKKFNMRDSLLLDRLSIKYGI